MLVNIMSINTLSTEQLSRLKLLSHSSDMLLHSCPIKYLITKINPLFGRLEQEANEHLSFGSVVGIGVQSYMETNSREAAIFKMLCAWDQFIDSDLGVKSKKSFWHSIFALDRFILFRAQELRNYELISFNGIPATELGFTIDCGDGYSYRGYLDCALWNEGTKQIVPLEIKTSGSYAIDPAMWINSPQGSAYKLVTDAIAAMLGLERSDRFQVIYGVYQSRQYLWSAIPFPKSRKTLALFIRNLLADKQLVQTYMQMDYFPQHGENCYSYGRECHLLGMCDKSPKLWMRDGIQYPDENDGRYQFSFRLEDLMDNLVGYEGSAEVEPEQMEIV